MTEGHLRLYCRTCGADLRILDRENNFYLQDNGLYSFDMTGFVCDCDYETQEPNWAMLDTRTGRDLFSEELDDEQLKKFMHWHIEGTDRHDLREQLEQSLLRNWEQERQSYIDDWSSRGEEEQEELRKLVGF